LAISLLTAGAVGWGFGQRASTFPPMRLCTFCTVFLLLLLIGARGGLQPQPLQIGDSFISGRPYLNAVALNPIYSAFGTLLARSERPAAFDEAASIDTVRTILELDAANSSAQHAFGVVSAEYPLLRESSGTAQGNRKNVVLFLLESWNAKD